MPSDIEQLDKKSYPALLQEINDPPTNLFIRGTLPKNVCFLTVVGSRNCTSYGRDVCRKIIRELAGFPVAIVSGLAIGIDAIAHREALAAGLPTVAFPGSGLSWDVLYPAGNKALAKHIVEAGGVLVSEFPEDTRAQAYMFPKRNRLMAGISQATLIIEAKEKSGSLITARLAVEYNRDVLVVPGPIHSATARGVNNLLKEGATPICGAGDVLDALGIEHVSQKTVTRELSPLERRILSALSEPLSKDELRAATGVQSHELQSTITSLELKGLLTETDGKIRPV